MVRTKAGRSRKAGQDSHGVLHAYGELLIAVHQNGFNQGERRYRGINALLFVRVVLEKERRADRVSRKRAGGKLHGAAVVVFVIGAMFGVSRIHDGVRVVRIHVDGILELVEEPAKSDGARVAQLGIRMEVIVEHVPVRPGPKVAKRRRRVRPLVEGDALLSL